RPRMHPSQRATAPTSIAKVEVAVAVDAGVAVVIVVSARRGPRLRRNLTTQATRVWRHHPKRPS
ncbi:MAG TPA: hypothetical protein VJV77_12755, partial [Casimicrobiaceae bacterium]|nr:hypothetical protein [Casimicrobiaceae bacterium]